MSEEKKTNIKKIISWIAGILVAAGILGAAGYKLITGEEYKKDQAVKVEQAAAMYSDGAETVVEKVTTETIAK